MIDVALRRPPQHRADATPIYVHPEDSAWDTERIDREIERLQAEGRDATEHPWSLYHGAAGRFDLDAEYTLFGEVVRPRDYLDGDKAPTLWHLRRLGVHDWYEIQPIFERAVKAGERPYAAYLRACTVGIEKVEGGPRLSLHGGKLGAADLDKLYEIGQRLPFEIGAAVYYASLPLTDSEGKH